MTRPTYLLIADDLRRQLAAGLLGPGDRVPSRHQLAAEYGVSDRVAVEAVRLLTAEGLLEAKPGSGTYVRRRPTVTRLTRSWYREARDGSPFRADMTAQGRTGDWESSTETTSASPAVAARLAIEEGADVVRTRYTFRADRQPVMLSTSYEPLTLTRGTPVMLPEAGPHAGRGVIDRMRVIGIQITAATELVTARPATAAEAERLALPVGSIVIVIERTYTAGERGPVETADIIVPTERYELAYVIPVGRD